MTKKNDVLPVRIYPDGVLRRTCEPVKVFDDDLRVFLQRMAETMYANHGIGLAANQAGDLRRLFVMDVPCNVTQDQADEMDTEADAADTATEEALESSAEDGADPLEADPAGAEPEAQDEYVSPTLRYIINPEIIQAEGSCEFYEGCLSIPGVRERIQRHRIIRLRYVDQWQNQQEEEFTDLEAVCVQHEIDHLNGTVIFDRLPVIKRRMSEKKYLKQLKNDQN